MKLRVLLFGVLCGGLGVSCQSHRTGTDALADNGGYSDGGFYGDSSTPAPSGYPQDGQTFATNDGMPFGHNDPVEAADPVEAVPARTVAVATERPAVARSTSDPYAAAYADGGAYAGDHGAERAVVTPYVERQEPVEREVPAAKPKVASSKSATKNSGGSKGSVKKAVAATPKKKATTVAATGKKSGTTVKAVYTPTSKGKVAAKPAKKKATVARVHEVKRGDTLSGLASRYGVTVAQLKKRNKLSADTIVIGKRLSID